ncbi:peptidoglycan DD-metalloendopeptidase family protein [Bacteroides sp. 51]|uniref:peptidoglycan DD-metalloendopeptidase family protein n=1 Tax=Bacteroides sp. 51 TaxID=2302938 RepID=UPI0013D04D3D|nr:peptidoglycan DD-metalloendopeptidase family protein [Bacteroides sp. 51]NDV80977.1 hypothetical protein [Bacteroides sp. 51]
MNPILRIILLACYATFSIYTYAQTREEPAVELRSEREKTGEKETFNIGATLNKPGSYSVVIRFLKQENMSEPATLLKVVKNSGNILKITPADPRQPINCRYNYSYTMGYEPRNVDSAFVYRLPYSTNRAEPVQINYLYNVDQRYLNRNRNIKWTALQFHLEKGDTIFAVRKGEVVKIQDSFDPMEREERVSYTSKANSITIEHIDGTICKYDIFEKGSFMVSEGDIVYPGTPLGLSGQQNATKGDYQLKLGVYYPVINPDYDPDDRKSSSFLYIYYNPVYATDQGNIKLDRSKKYKAVSSKELEQKEMTKKEIKRR